MWGAPFTSSLSVGTPAASSFLQYAETSSWSVNITRLVRPREPGQLVGRTPGSIGYGSQLIPSGLFPSVSVV